MVKKQFWRIFLTSIVMVALGVMLASRGIGDASPSTTIMVDPKVSGKAPIESFSINVTVSDVTELYTWQFNLSFNPAVLQAVRVVEGPFLKQAGTTWMPTPNIDNATGFVLAGCSLFPYPENGATGGGVLATVTFKVIAEGKSSLHFLEGTKLRTWDSNAGVLVPIAYVAVDGVFGYPRDLAITGVVASSASVPAGESVSVNVTVKNRGNIDETFNVTAYYNLIAISTKTDLTLEAGTNRTLSFTWDTTGVAAGGYTMRAEVSIVAGENDTSNNVLADGTVTIELVHDVAVTNVTVSSSSVSAGAKVSVNVTVFNKGSATETFDVTLSYDSAVIGTQTVTDLIPGASRILTFTWETKDVVVGDYVLTATTSTVSGETKTADNVYTNVSVKVTAPSTLPLELLLISAVAVLVVLGSVAFLYMRRKSKKA